ncbi:Uncharacterised protein [Legionella busanensis]|uniref:Uncharacterized protein n=1 Tax=Legionella busanensis TaxID=190655 RepID=A0A378JJR9_9GAMM|nr:hypothetical protein [Legionella busanensis]STX51414.1 Uncharacterised protein [Legionella busanensis]
MRRNFEGLSTLRVNKIRNHINALEVQERNRLITDTGNMIRGRMADHSDDEIENSFKLVCERYISEPEEVERILDRLKNCQDKSEKTKFIATFVAEQESIPSEEFIAFVKKFLEIIKNDSELNSFLANPQEYINNQKHRSAYALQILQFVINNPRFNSLPDVNRKIPSDTFISTWLTSYLYQLNLLEYGAKDAIRFPECIHPDWKEQVLAKAKKNYNGPQTIGTGALPYYTRRNIAETAKHVAQMKMGECHSFAQLAADHLLKFIAADKFTSIDIKMVSHVNGLGTHTFLLIGHQSDNLEDLNNCLIVDLWAVAMGHLSTYGVYTQENYPFPSMLTKLVCCYDSRAPLPLPQHSQSNSSSSIQQDIKTTVLSGNFFTKKLTPPIKKHLTPLQQAVIDFLKALDKHAVNRVKKDLLKDLIKAVEDKKIKPEKVLNLAVSAYYAKLIEKIRDKDKYVWKQMSAIDNALVEAFNKPYIKEIWQSYINENNIRDTLGSDISITTINAIVHCLNKNEEHEFINQSILNSNKMCFSGN